MKIEIITIGDEILIGQIVDTNSAWMGVELNKLGWDVVAITTVGDVHDDIIKAFDVALQRADIVLVTGGTGPTKDDITKNILCEYFDSKLIFNQSILDNVEAIFANRAIKINELTKTQAWVPDKAVVLMNRVGTAPCLWFEKDGKVLVSMAGVPSEMKWLMSNEILPKLEKTFNDGSAVEHRTLLVKDYSESALAEKLSDFEANLPKCFKLAYLPQQGIVRLRLTGRNHDKNVLIENTDKYAAQLKSILGKAIYSDVDLPLEKLVGLRLKQLKITMATAESCTGGTIAKMITSVPGSSEYFMGGIVSYSNLVKESVLNVDKKDIETFGAVSETVVRQMAKGAIKVCSADCSVATSGIAGPDGGTKDKPVGTVWICAQYKEKQIARLYNFGTIREYNTVKASNCALQLLLEILE
ncbi:MAG: competence/damage-inducible protein A [Bacteroidales bacterium]|nr:competence/damage-inducible protein A [Bacteroidales bacterium]